MEQTHTTTHPVVDFVNRQYQAASNALEAKGITKASVKEFVRSSANRAHASAPVQAIKNFKLSKYLPPVTVKVASNSRSARLLSFSTVKGGGLNVSATPKLAKIAKVALIGTVATVAAVSSPITFTVSFLVGAIFNKQLKGVNDFITRQWDKLEERNTDFPSKNRKIIAAAALGVAGLLLPTIAAAYLGQRIGAAARETVKNLMDRSHPSNQELQTLDIPSSFDTAKAMQDVTRRFKDQ